jgi:FMN phosphatase YigB (HAD superfamily)
MRSWFPADASLIPRAMIFFFDCDNTLLDNDRFHADLDAYLEREIGVDGKGRYWSHYETLRDAQGFADYLGAVQHLRLERPGDPAMSALSAFLLEYPFDGLLYPGAFDAIEHCRRFGTPALLSDGDAVFQPRKLQRSGLWRAVEGRALVYVHKERMLDDVTTRYPARHYVMTDDKLTLLDAMKAVLRDRLTTVWPRQGHYAREAAQRGDLPRADVTIERIGEILRLDFSTQPPEFR